MKMSFEVAVVCAAQGEAAGAGSANKLFFSPAAAFTQHISVTTPLALKRSGKLTGNSSVTRKMNLKHRTHRSLPLSPPFIFVAFWEIGSSKFSRRRRDSPGCERDKMMSADHELVNLSNAFGYFRWRRKRLSIELHNVRLVVDTMGTANIRKQQLSFELILQVYHFTISKLSCLSWEDRHSDDRLVQISANNL